MYHLTNDAIRDEIRHLSFGKDVVPLINGSVDLLLEAAPILLEAVRWLLLLRDTPGFVVLSNVSHFARSV